MDIYIYMAMERDIRIKTHKWIDQVHVCVLVYSTKEIPTATPGRVFKAVLRSRSSVSNVSEVLRIPRWCDGMAWWVRTPDVGGIAYRESPGRKMVANVCT